MTFFYFVFNGTASAIFSNWCNFMYAKRCVHAALIVIAAFLCLVLPPPVLAQSPPATTSAKDAKLKERDAQLAAAKNAVDKGDFAAAITAGEKKLAIEREIFADKHPELIDTIIFLAKCEELREHWDAAQIRRNEVLDRTAGAYGNDDYRVVNARQAIRHLALLQRMTPEQRRSLIEAKATYRQIVQLNRDAKYVEGIELAKGNVHLLETILGSDHPETASSLNVLALLYQSQGNNEVAESLYQRALKIDETILGRNHPETATNLHNLAALYKSQGKYSIAEPLYQQALKIREKTVGPDHPDTALSMNNLALFLYSQGNYVAAEPLFLRALKIYEKAPGTDGLDIARCVNNLALLYRAQGNYAAEEPLYQRALKIYEQTLGPEHPNTATVLNNLADLYRMQAKYADAEPLYRRSFQIREKIFGTDHPETASSLNNLGTLYSIQGNYSASEASYKRALNIFEKSLGAEHPLTAAAMHNLANVYQMQFKYKEAEPLYERSLGIWTKAGSTSHPDALLNSNSLASIYWDQRQFPQARKLMAHSTPLQIEQLERTAAIQTEGQMFLMTSQTKSAIDFYLTVQLTDPAAATETWKTLLDWKGLITARQTRLRRTLRKDPSYAALELIARQLSTHLLNPPRPPNEPQLIAAWNNTASARREAWEAQRRRLEAEFEKCEKDMSAKSALFRASLAQRHISPQDVQRLLASQKSPTGLIDLLEYTYQDRAYFPTEQRVVAFVARGDRDITRVELGSAQEIQSLITTWEKTFGRGDEAEKAGARLRERIWQPLLPALEGIEVAVISPDGVLGAFPWGALPGTKSETYLMEEISLAVIPVPQMLPQLLETDSNNGSPESLLLVGDITYGGDAGTPGDSFSTRAMRRPRDGKPMQFGPLSAARQEMSSIQDRYVSTIDVGRVNRLQKDAATESAFREQATRHKWLHIITHGYFAPESVATSAPKIAGIGASLRVEEGRLIIKQIVAGGAAAKDGHLRVGDEIVAVTNSDGESVQLSARSLEEVLSLVRGPVGSEIRLKIRPKDEGSDIAEYTLRRASIAVPARKADVTDHPGLLSGLAFAGANLPPNDGKDDGILTALEVSALDLSNVDTVVLSACETGLGEAAGSEGLLGLQRAFQVAGAHTCVASLWSVHDTATQILMLRFYENLWQRRMGKLEALREAQIWALRNPKEFFGKFTKEEKFAARGLDLPPLDEIADGQPTPVYYWAPFVLSGDWR